MASPLLDPTIAFARANLGRTESPAGSNRFRLHNGIDLWSWYDARLQGQPYCAAGVSASWALGGGATIPIQAPNGFSYTPIALKWFRDRGLVVPMADARLGDLAFMQFDSDPQVDHVGFVVGRNADGSLVTVEFNTSPGWQGSQSNGGGCFQRSRKSAVAAVCRPTYAAPAPPAAVSADFQQRVRTKPMLAEGAGASGTPRENQYHDVGILQALMLWHGATPVSTTGQPTGRFDWQTRKSLAAWQARCKVLRTDGVCDAATWDWLANAGSKPTLAAGAGVPGTPRENQYHDVGILQALMLWHRAQPVSSAGRPIGRFDAGTRDSLTAWQGRTGVLRPDGMCGGETWAWLVNV